MSDAVSELSMVASPAGVRRAPFTASAVSRGLPEARGAAVADGEGEPAGAACPVPVGVLPGAPSCSWVMTRVMIAIGTPRIVAILAGMARRLIQEARRGSLAGL